MPILQVFVRFGDITRQAASWSSVVSSCDGWVEPASLQPPAAHGAVAGGREAVEAGRRVGQRDGEAGLEGAAGGPDGFGVLAALGVGVGAGQRTLGPGRVGALAHERAQGFAVAAGAQPQPAVELADGGQEVTTGAGGHEARVAMLAAQHQRDAVGQRDTLPGPRAGKTGHAAGRLLRPLMVAVLVDPRRPPRAGTPDRNAGLGQGQLLVAIGAPLQHAASLPQGRRAALATDARSLVPVAHRTPTRRTSLTPLRMNVQGFVPNGPTAPPQ